MISGSQGFNLFGDNQFRIDDFLKHGFSTDGGSDDNSLWKTCPAIHVVEDFDVDRYTGTWYEMFRGSDSIFEKGECVLCNLYKRDDGQLDVVNSQAKVADDGSFLPRDGVKGWGRFAT